MQFFLPYSWLKLKLWKYLELFLSILKWEIWDVYLNIQMFQLLPFSINNIIICLHTEKSLTSHLRILFLFHFISFPYRLFLVWVIIYWGHVHCFLLHRSIFHPKMHHQIHWHVYQSWKVATCAKDCNWRTTGLRVFVKMFFPLEQNNTKGDGEIPYDLRLWSLSPLFIRIYLIW